MKFLLFLVFLIKFLINFTSAEEITTNKYCELQSALNYSIHIGCPTSWSLLSQLSSRNSNFTLGKLSDETKEDYTKLFNYLKNSYAFGTYETQGFPSATNFTVLEWNDELEFLANKSVELLPYEVDAGAEISIDEAVYSMVYLDSNNTAIDEFISDALHYFVVATEVKDVTWMGNYFGPSTKFGCGYGEYNQFDYDSFSFIPVKTMRCLFTTTWENYDSYIEGKPCSDCISGKCSETYPALCIL